MPRVKAELSRTTTSPQLQRRTVPRINAEPAVPAASPHAPQSTNLQPITPSNGRRQRAQSDDDYEPETPSPTKRAKTRRGAPPPTPSTALTTPTSAARTPSQKALRAAKRKQEKEWKPDWNAVVARNIWTVKQDFRHPESVWTICLAEAMKRFPMNRADFDMLPYQSGPNKHNPRCPMRLYNIETVRRRACLKHAILAGLRKNGLSQAELVSRGEELWKAAQRKRDQRYINRRFRPVILTPYGARDGPTNLASEAVEDYDTESEAVEDYDSGPEVYDDYRSIDLSNFCRRINE